MNLEKYLSQATKGLWGKKKLEVREEITAHILERAYKHEVSGVEHDLAITQAIAELGDPKTIRAGMIGVHTMPNLFKISGFLTVIAAGAIAMLSVSSAQVTGTTRMPIAACTNDPQVTTISNPSNSNDDRRIPCEGGLWLDLNSLRATLKTFKVEFSEGQLLHSNAKQLYLFFPQGGMALIQQPQTLYFGFGAKFPLSGDYIPSSSLVEGLRFLAVPFTMSGWDNPTLRVGQVKFQIGSNEIPIRGSDWYISILYPRIQSLMSGWTSDNIWLDAPNYMEERATQLKTPTYFRNYQHKIQTELPSGQIVVVLNRAVPRTIEVAGRIPETLPSFIRAYIATVGENGVLEYPSEAKSLRFVDQLKNMRLTKQESAGDIVILKFTHQMNLGKETFAIIPSSKLSK